MASSICPVIRAKIKYSVLRLSMVTKNLLPSKSTKHLKPFGGGEDFLDFVTLDWLSEELTIRSVMRAESVLLWVKNSDLSYIFNGGEESKTCLLSEKLVTDSEWVSKALKAIIFFETDLSSTVLTIGLTFKLLVTSIGDIDVLGSDVFCFITTDSSPDVLITGSAKLLAILDLKYSMVMNAL